SLARWLGYHIKTRTCMYWSLFLCGPRLMQQRHARPARANLASTSELSTLQPCAGSGSGPETAGPQFQHAVDDRIDRLTCRVDHCGIGRGLERSDRTSRIPQVPLGDLARKGGKANIEPLVFQLLITAQGAFFGAGGEKYLEVGLGKYN